MTTGCMCEEWKKYAPEIDGAIILAWTHRGKYTGGPFRYCPWCGKATVSLDGEQK